ncbi:unnamed protein product, partial [Ectocarpus sp. 13 AM-2016]
MASIMHPLRTGKRVRERSPREEKVDTLSKRLKIHELQGVGLRADLKEAQNQLMEEKINCLARALRSGDCVICRGPLHSCLGSESMGLVSYACRCTKVPLVAKVPPCRGTLGNLEKKTLGTDRNL